MSEGGRVLLQLVPGTGASVYQQWSSAFRQETTSQILRRRLGRFLALPPSHGYKVALYIPLLALRQRFVRRVFAGSGGGRGLWGGVYQLQNKTTSENKNLEVALASSDEVTLLRHVRV